MEIFSKYFQNPNVSHFLQKRTHSLIPAARFQKQHPPFLHKDARLDTPFHTMRQTDYRVNLSRARLRRARLRCLKISLFHDGINLRTKLRIARRASMLRQHIRKIVYRSSRIAMKQFDLDSYDERRALRDFRFLRSEIKGRTLNNLSWQQLTNLINCCHDK